MQFLSRLSHLILKGFCIGFLFAVPACAPVKTMCEMNHIKKTRRHRGGFRDDFFCDLCHTCLLTAPTLSLVIIELINLFCFIVLGRGEESRLGKQFELWVNLLHSCEIDNFPNLIRAVSRSSCATSLILLICFMSVMSLCICLLLVLSSASPLSLSPCPLSYTGMGWVVEIKMEVAQSF